MRRSAPRTPDFGRMRRSFESPKNYVAYGTVGHTDQTPKFARIEDGDVLVEVTLAPSGDEIVARLDLGAVEGGGGYLPLSYGQRVLVAFPGGEGGESVIIGRLHDKAWPFPDDVAGVPTNVAGAAPAFAFFRTGDGQLVAIETGAGGDIVVHSGGSTWTRTGPGEQTLITGRTHIGSDVEPTTPPVPSLVGPDGYPTPGVGMGPYIPAPNTNTMVVAGLPITPVIDNKGRVIPADGVVRLKDKIEGSNATDPQFFGWVLYVFLYLEALTPILDGLTGGAWSTTLDAAVAAGGGVPPVTPPAGVAVNATSASLNTVGDD